MSNKAFFNSFFKQNKIWQQIQNNPVAHQYWFPHKIPLFAAYHVLNRGTPARTDIDYNHRIRYHGPANPRIRTRIRRYDVKDYLPNFPSTIKTKKQAWDYTHDRHLSDFPAIGAHLLSHRAHGLTLAQRQQRSLENVQAMLGAGNFVSSIYWIFTPASLRSLCWFKNLSAVMLLRQLVMPPETIT